MCGPCAALGIAIRGRDWPRINPESNDNHTIPHSFVYRLPLIHISATVVMHDLQKR